MKYNLRLLQLLSVLNVIFGPEVGQRDKCFFPLLLATL
jgi:hypothetical protein